MSMHVVGYETSASQAALTALVPIPDGTVQIQNNDVFVPKGMNNIVAAAAMINSATATLRAQLQAPSLRSILNFDVGAIKNGLVFGSLPPMNRMWNTPLQLVEGEPLDFTAQNGAAVMNRGFVWLADGPVKPVGGRIYTVRCTGAASLVTATWQNTALTFGQALPSGDYQVVGFRAWSANGCVARLFFKASGWRPGVPMGNTEADDTWTDFRFGNMGVLGEFNNLTPPSVDVMGITDSAQVFFLDLIKVR